MVFSTVDPGQGFSADAQLHFSGKKTTAEVGHGDKETCIEDNDEKEVGVDKVDANEFEETPMADEAHKMLDEVIDGADDSIDPCSTSSDFFQPTPTDSGVGLFGSTPSTHSKPTKCSFPREPQMSSVQDSVCLHPTS